MEEDKRASCCYVLLDRPEGENHCVSYSKAALRHAFSFGESREVPLALSRMNFSIRPVYEKERYSAQYFVTMSACFREPGYLHGKTCRIPLSLLYYVHCFNELSPMPCLENIP